MIETLKEVREALHKARRQITHATRAPHQCIADAITKLDALIAAQEKAEPVDRSDNYLNGYCVGRSDLLKELNTLERCYSKCFDERADLIERLEATPQPAPSTSPLTDIDIAAAIEVADAKWADANVPLEWAKHFARAIEAKIGAKP